MTRYAIDAATLLRLVTAQLEVHPDHQLVAPNAVRSHALTTLLRQVQAGELTEREARELHTRLGSMGETTARVGRSLQRAVEEYNAWVGTLERRVLVTARRMEQLAVTDDRLGPVPAVESLPRPLTAAELVDRTG